MLDEIISVITAEKLKSCFPKTLIIPTGIIPGYLQRQITMMVPGGCITNLNIFNIREFIRENTEEIFSTDSTFLSDDATASMLKIIITSEEVGDYFKEVNNFPGLYTLLAETIEELRLNYFANYPDKTKKWGTIEKIMEIYAQMKSEGRLYDYADAVMAMISSDRSFPDTYIAEFNLKGAEIELCQKKGIRIIPLTNGLSGKNILSGKIGAEFSGFITETKVQEVQMIINSVLKDLRDGVNRITIAVTDYDLYYPLFKKMISERKLEDVFTFTQSDPFLLTRQGELWKLYCDWVKKKFSVNRFLKILESSSFEKSCFSKDSAIFFAALREIKNTQHARLTDKIINKLETPAEGEGDIITGDQKNKSEAITVAAKIIESFLPLTQIKSTDNLQLLISHYQKYCHSSSEDDNRLKKYFINKYNKFISLLEGPETDLEKIISGFNEQLAVDYTDRSLPCFDRPLICTMNEALYTAAEKLHITGLNENGLPARLLENPILSDIEKIELRKDLKDAKLPTLSELYSFADKRFYRVIANATRVVFSAPVKDLGSGREYLLSRYFLDAIAQSGREISISDAGAKDYLNNQEFTQRGFIHKDPDRAFNSYEKILSANLTKSGIAGELPPYSQKVRYFRETLKTMKSFNELWGKPRIIFPYKDRVFDASRISAWASCPQMFYLKYLLGLKPSETTDEQGLEWLDSLGKGMLVHELFERFYHFKTAKKKNYDHISTTNDHKAIIIILNELIEEYKHQYPVNCDIYYLSQLNELMWIAGQFINNEADNNAERLFAEYSIAASAKKKCIASAEPVEITLEDGEKVKFKGSIDRVDRLEGKFILYDYKTGKRIERNKLFNGGKLIQSGLYPLLLNKLNKTTSDMLFNYYYTSRAGNFEIDQFEWNKDSRQILMKLLTAIINQIFQGNYPVKDDIGDRTCSHCDFNEVCQKDKHQLNQQLTDDPLKEQYKKISSEEL